MMTGLLSFASFHRMLAWRTFCYSFCSFQKTIFFGPILDWSTINDIIAVYWFQSNAAKDKMIKVENLTRRFGRTLAIDNLSFEVKQGEIVGFLGPNGAGKTTTMRILSCFLPATGGKVTIGGFDVFADSLEVRRRIGYLPENVPLSSDMR